MKILIIDDDKSTLLLYGAYFQKKHQVFTESDSRVAIKTFKETQPDVVLLNSCMPHVDGFTIAKEIKEISDCRIIMMSASILEEEEYVDCCDSFFPKPSRPEVIKEMVLG